MDSDKDQNMELTPIDEEADNVSMDNSVDSVNSVKSKRGRKRIPECWSRVINLRSDDLSNLQVFELAPDLTLINGLKATQSRGKKAKKWKPLFWPDLYVEEGHSMKVADNILSQAQLLKYAKKVSKARKL